MAAYPDGTLVHDTGTGREYVIAGGALHYIPWPALLQVLGYPQVPLTRLSPSEVAAIPQGDQAHFPEGTLLRDQDTGSVFVVTQDVLHGIASQIDLQALGFLGAPFLNVSHEFILQVPQGALATVGNVRPQGAVIARLNETVPLYSVVGSDFQTTVAQTLANAGTNTDGFDVLIAPAMSGFDGDVAALTELDGHLGAMDYTDGDFRSGNIDPIVADTQPFLDSGDAIINTPAGGPPAADPGGGPAPISNPPAPAPSPVIGGGGGGGGGGAGRGGDPCIEGDEYPFCGPDFPTK